MLAFRWSLFKAQTQAELQEYKFLPCNKYYIWFPTEYLTLQTPFGHRNTTTSPEILEIARKKNTAQPSDASARYWNDLQKEPGTSEPSFYSLTPHWSEDCQGNGHAFELLLEELGSEKTRRPKCKKQTPNTKWKRYLGTNKQQSYIPLTLCCETYTPANSR